MLPGIFTINILHESILHESVDFKKKDNPKCVLGKILRPHKYTPQLNTKMSSSQTLITKKKTKR